MLCYWFGIFHSGQTSSLCKCSYTATYPMYYNTSYTATYPMYYNTPGNTTTTRLILNNTLTTTKRHLHEHLTGVVKCALSFVYVSLSETSRLSPLHTHDGLGHRQYQRPKHQIRLKIHPNHYFITLSHNNPWLWKKVMRLYYICTYLTLKMSVVLTED